MFTVCLCLPDIGNSDKTNDLRAELRMGDGGGGEGGYKSYLAAPRYINIYKEKKTFHSMHHEPRLILLMNK